jgi:hippurate hydrolase
METTFNNIMITPGKLKELTHQYAPMLASFRHHLHANPELSFQEFETSQFIGRQLNEWGIDFKNIAGTGIEAVIEGKNPSSKTIALRADIDALPIKEENSVAYKSKNEGVMHACGHDVHTTCLLGATKILKDLQDEWEGTIKLIFQPGEEKNPGGASLMIRDGVLENPKPDAIVAMHVHPGLQIGKLSFRKGLIMASADEIYITIKGKGGHAAAPHLTTDIVLVAAHIIVGLQQIISRNNNPLTPSVLSICSIHGGSTTNVIPTEVKLVGTFRAMDETWRYRAHELIQQQVLGIARAMGAEAEILIDVGYPAVYNDAAVTEKATALAQEYFGDENIEETEMRMGAEDFGFYAQKLPACFFRLGVRNEAAGIVHNVHTSRFNIDEDALQAGAGIMAWLGMNLKIN